MASDRMKRFNLSHSLDISEISNFKERYEVYIKQTVVLKSLP